MHLTFNTTQIVISQDPVDPDESSVMSGKTSGTQSTESIKLMSSTKVVPRK